MNLQPNYLTKRTHRLPPQTSVLWIPSASGYLERFTLGSFSVVKNAALAQQFNEDRASAAALNFKRTTGLNVAVRPYYSI